MYKDAGAEGQLAYCSYDQKPDDLTVDDIMLGIGDTEYSEDGLLHVQISFKKPEESVIKYNIDNYMLSYHILDSEGDILQWDNDKHQINRW